MQRINYMKVWINCAIRSTRNCLRLRRCQKDLQPKRSVVFDMIQDFVGTLGALLYGMRHTILILLVLMGIHGKSHRLHFKMVEKQDLDAVTMIGD